MVERSWLKMPLYIDFRIRITDTLVGFLFGICSATVVLLALGLYIVFAASVHLHDCSLIRTHRI